MHIMYGQACNPVSFINQSDDVNVLPVLGRIAAAGIALCSEHVQAILDHIQGHGTKGWRIGTISFPAIWKNS